MQPEVQLALTPTLLINSNLLSIKKWSNVLAMLTKHPRWLKQPFKHSWRNKLSFHPPNLKDVFTKASGLSSCGNSSARISSGGRGSWTIVGRGFSLTFPVSPSMKEFHRQFWDLDPKDEGGKKMYTSISNLCHVVPSYLGCSNAEPGHFYIFHHLH